MKPNISKAPSVKLIQKPEELPIPFEVIAQAVLDLSKVGQAIERSKLSRRAQLLLLQDLSGVSMRDVGRVLDALPELEAVYIKK